MLGDRPANRRPVSPTGADGRPRSAESRQEWQAVAIQPAISFVQRPKYMAMAETDDDGETGDPYDLRRVSATADRMLAR
jgi:hypothetical protein